ncbi:thermonuclease family protein [Rhodospirillum sp. A1_3_36]|uniref:thermonuclease family protein n=1 Tax=Rhodospirillum sp. A1_3_36 TaxID=3391666 RepID=UPI0039A62DC4
MMDLLAWVVAGVASLGVSASDPASPAPGDILAGLPGRVSDGDTFRIQGIATRIRIWGVDAPELSTREGPAAREALRALLGDGPVACRVIDTDQYGRAVARCFAGDRDLAEDLVRRGCARDWPRYSGGAYARVPRARVCR